MRRLFLDIRERISSLMQNRVAFALRSLWDCRREMLKSALRELGTTSKVLMLCCDIQIFDVVRNWRTATARRMQWNKSGCITSSSLVGGKKGGGNSVAYSQIDLESFFDAHGSLRAL